MKRCISGITITALFVRSLWSKHFKSALFYSFLKLSRVLDRIFSPKAYIYQIIPKGVPPHSPSIALVYILFY